MWTCVGGLSVAVEGPSKAEIRCSADLEYEDDDNSSYTVTYYPLIAGTYSIGVQVAGKHIPGSPFTANVLPPGASLNTDVLSPNSIRSN